MIYTWTDAERARIVPGATVQCPALKKRRPLFAGVERDREGVLFLSYVDDYAPTCRNLCDVDPSTLRAPTLAWLRETARRKLGKRAVVELTMSGRVAREVGVRNPDRVSLFFGEACREHAALWLHALPEVSP